MSETLLSSRNLAFELYEVLDAEGLTQRERFAEHTRETFDAAISTARTIAEKYFAPHNRKNDENEPRYEDGQAILIPEVKPAVDAFLEAGFLNAARSFEAGGMQLPTLLSQACFAHFQSANAASTSYPFLTMGAANLIESFGTDDQKQRFLQPMIDGRFFGTMALTEPHAGSSLSDIRTRAEPAADGTYRLKGNKIFISGGDHPLSENIVHMVLAKLPDAPAGVKGISLFIVPKFHADSGERNAVHCGSIEHKMGIKGSATCVLNFDGAKGFLIGEANKGLNCMFTMMNHARLGTGMQGLCNGEASFQGAIKYANDRLQMRSLTGAKAPEKAADPIIVHPDVRRMLLTMKAFNEGNRALTYFTAQLLDTAHLSSDATQRQDAEDLLAFLTPICKAFMTDTGLEVTNHGMQVFGGHGYIREWGMEQLARDARIAPIYEGTNGIQALDLLGRKVLGSQGKLLRGFTRIVHKFCGANAEHPQLKAYVAQLNQLNGEWGELTTQVGMAAMKNPDEVGAAAVDYLMYSGYVILAYLWLRMAIAALEQQDTDFAKAKLATCDFYFKRLLPRTASHRVAVQAGSECLMSLPAEAFAL